MNQPLLLGQPLLDAVAGLERRVGYARLLHAVETEMARVVAAEVVAAEVPALGAVDELVGLHLPLDELVLVLLVVVELEDAPLLDRLVDRTDHLRVVAAGRYLKALLRRVVAERLDDLLPRRR